MSYFRVVALLALGLIASASCWETEQELMTEFSEEFFAYHKSGVQSPALQTMLDEYALPRELMFTNWHYPHADQPRVDSLCVTCKLAVNTMLDAHAANDTTEEIAQVMVGLCQTLGLSTDRVCEGTVEANIPVLDFLLNNADLSADRMCHMMLQGHECGADDPLLEWSIDLSQVKETDRAESVAGPKNAKANPFSVLHLTDIHYDPNYLVGGNADCGEPMCCRGDQGVPEFENATAGRWGHYNRCDIPWEVVTDALDHITRTHPNNVFQVDYIYMTGDLVDHGVWDTSLTHNNATIVKVMDQLKATFGDIPVFPCLGNHEPHPLNIFAPVSITEPTLSTAWLYETMADAWSAWLPADTRATILAGGFYTVLVRPGFRVVALNNLQCYVYNWFLYDDHNDPDGQLAWLVTVLAAAEGAGEKVHLLYHMPTGRTDCYWNWSREFNRIVNRFANTVTAQFNGHTHWDEFHVVYSDEIPPAATSVVFTAGSLTSYADVNANYRVYTVDGDDLTVTDHETWIYNMTEANLSPADTINWFKMYSFKEAYGVNSLSPVELDGLAQSMATDVDLMQQYFRFFYLLGDPKMEEGCDVQCMEDLLCGIVTNDSNDSSQCDLILSKMRERRGDFLE